MLKNSDVESIQDFRQYYQGATTLIEGRICYIRQVEYDGIMDKNGYVHLNFWDTGEQDIQKYSALKDKMLFGHPRLGIREVDGQLYYYGIKPFRNGKRGYRADHIHLMSHTDSQWESVFYTAEAGAHQTKAMKEVFLPTFHAVGRAIDRLIEGSTLGCAINYDTGLFTKPRYGGAQFLAFRGSCAGYYENRALTLYEGFEGLREYMTKIGGL